MPSDGRLAPKTTRRAQRSTGKATRLQTSCEIGPEPHLEGWSVAYLTGNGRLRTFAGRMQCFFSTFFRTGSPTPP